MQPLRGALRAASGQNTVGASFHPGRHACKCGGPRVHRPGNQANRWPCCQPGTQHRTLPPRTHPKTAPPLPPHTPHPHTRRRISAARARVKGHIPSSTLGPATVPMTICPLSCLATVSTAFLVGKPVRSLPTLACSL